MISHSAPWITAADRAAVDQCLTSGQLASGTLVQRFEDAVRDYVGAAWARSTPSGTTALATALRILGIGPGDHVVLPTYVCIDVEHAIRAVGATPQFADVGDDGTVTAETAGRAVTRQTRAIVAVHIFGHPCAIGPLKTFGIPVIEDACQGFAASAPEGVAGTLGDIGVYSFHATKCLTTGEGGMIVSGGAELGDDAVDPALCSPLSDLQAALGLAQLSRYEEMRTRRAVIGARYDSALSARSSSSHRSAGDLFRFTFALRSDASFEAAAGYFADRGVSVRRGVDALLHRAHRLDDSRFPVACALFARNASVPFYPALTDDQVATVAEALSEYDGVA